MAATISLPTLFARALSFASKAYSLPNTDDEAQTLVHSALNDLNVLDARITALSLFSPNELLEDISTTDLIYIFVPYVCAEVQGRVRATERDERMLLIEQSQRLLNIFLSKLESLEIVPETERSLHEKKSSLVSDPVARRELKIKQYKKERELRSRIEVVRKRRGQVPVNDDSQTNFDLILHLLPSSSGNNSEDEDDADEILRETTLLLLRLFYAQAHSQLESMHQEREILRTAPPPPSSQPPDDTRQQKEKASDSMWRLDTSTNTGEGPLLDESGRPLRTFTILPSGAVDRARFQAQVFAPGHNLPTMSVDEYLEIERQRGNILTGGGPQSVERLTTQEQLALDAEMEGTAMGENKSEEKRQKDEKWARYTDDNPRGQGNTMNRG